MSLIPDNIKDEIRRSVYLPEVLVNSGVNIRRAGHEWRGVCPFEQGSGNSGKFRVKEDHYHCFGCRKSGDIFSWLQDKEGVSFREAAKIAAELAGINIEEFLAPKKAAPKDPRREAVEELMGLLSSLSSKTASALPLEEKMWEGVPLGDLIENGEVGRFPSRGEVARHLKALSVSEQALRDVGLSSKVLESLCEGWVLWARKKGRPIALRPFQKVGPVVGTYGSRSEGWIHPPKASVIGKSQGGVCVAEDDGAYLALRVAGILPVFRALTPQTLTKFWGYVPNNDSKANPPVLVTLSEKEAQRATYENALSLLEQTPRLRVAELSLLGVGLSDPDAWRDGINRAIQKAGTAFDWQATLSARHGLLNSDEGRLLTARRLSRIVREVKSPVERVVFEAEMKSLTRWDLVDLDRVEARDEGMKEDRTGVSSRSTRAR